jgi:hypothetical protein
MSDMVSRPLGRADGSYGTIETSFVTLLPKGLVLIAALTLMVGGAIPQLEMAITGGSVPLMPRQFSLLCLGLASVILLKGRFKSSPLLPLTISLLTYGLLELLFLRFYKGLSFEETRSSLGYLLFLLLACTALVVPLRIKPRYIFSLLLIATFACIVLSAAQFVTNSPIVPTDSADQSFHVESYKILDKTRCFSLFPNGLQAGLFYSFMGAVATSLCLRRGTRTFGLLLLSLCAFGCYATYTRLTIVGFLLSVIAVFIMSRKRLARLGKLLPIFSLCCALLVIVQGLRTPGGAGRNDLANTSSLDQRFLDWGICGGKFLAGSPLDMLFGIGQGAYVRYGSPGRPDNASPIPIDNAYLLIPLSSGICGLVLIGFVYWCLWRFLYKRALSSKDHLLKGIAGIFSTVPFVCSISDPPIQILLCLLIAFSLDDETEMTSVPVPPAPLLQGSAVSKTFTNSSAGDHF